MALLTSITWNVTSNACIYWYGLVGESSTSRLPQVTVEVTSLYWNYRCSALRILFNKACYTISDGLKVWQNLGDYLMDWCKSKKVQAVNVAGLGGLYGCEMLKLSHYLDIRLSDGGEVNLTPRPRSTPQKHLFLCFWYSFMLEAL
jgi:hypothetical protein